jgi:hypothetical protein
MWPIIVDGSTALQVDRCAADTACMEMKAMMFAGGGLFLSMVATTMWISGDVTRMREETKAKQQAACTTPEVPQTGAAPGVEGFAPAPGSADGTADPDCAPTTADGAPVGDAQGAAIDPVTGQPIDGASFDDQGGGTYADPNASNYSDPNASSYADPNAGGYADQGASPYDDPNADQAPPAYDDSAGVQDQTATATSGF